MLFAPYMYVCFHTTTSNDIHLIIHVYLNANVSQHLCKFLHIDSNISFGDITIDKSSSFPCIQYDTQSGVAYGCSAPDSVRTAVIYGLNFRRYGRN